MSDTSAISRLRIAPLTLLSVAVAVGILVIVVVTLLAHQRPWLGLKLAATDETSGILVRAGAGPAAGIPAGTILSAVENDDDRIDFTALEMVTEPDGAMGSYENYRRFLERHERLARIQSSPEIIFYAADGRRFVVEPSLTGRPLRDLPPDFWVQCFVGLLAWLVSAAVFVFRLNDAGARYLLLSGAATLIFAPAAAVYTTRELAVPGPLLQIACDLNFFGGSLFAASFVGLLLVYPRRIAPRWAGPSIVGLYILWFALQQIGVFESMTFARRFLVMLGVAATFALALVHWRFSRRDPLARAKLQWFLLSWVFGTSAFALFILLPQSFGVDTSPIQGYAFLLFLLVYGGLALGILRYRLFELGDWWRRVMLWVTAVLLLVVLDVFFVYTLHLSTEASLALALLICGLVWLPLRGWIWERFVSRRGQNAQDLFQRVVDVALAPKGAEERSARWRALLKSVFEPLEVREATHSETVCLRDDGLFLDLPAVAAIGALGLGYPRGGRDLFHPRDVALAEDLVAMLRHATASLAAYETGVAQERGRIARDIHDNIGAQLLRALHNAGDAGKDACIRQTLADLRSVINEDGRHSQSLGMCLAELRLETIERLEAAGITWAWASPDDPLPATDPGRMHAIRSVLREAISNAIRHSGASHVAVAISAGPDRLRLEIEDNGKGFADHRKTNGRGLVNMRQRVEELDGTFRLDHLSSGTRIAAEISLGLGSSRQ